MPVRNSKCPSIGRVINPAKPKQDRRKVKKILTSVANCRICETAGEEWNSIQEIDKNNSKLEDRGIANQAITSEAIELLKAQGISGREMVETLTQNSATFQQKTQYSQVESFVSR